MERFAIDIHVHTSEVSGCGQVEAAEAVRMYQSAGYQGIMVTDHFHRQYFESLNLKSWEDQIDRYLEGYRKAGEEGRRIGMEVLLGIEFRNFETDNDFLVIGITEKFLYEHPYIYNLPLEQAIDLFHENDMLVIQAHPARGKIVDMKDGHVFAGFKSGQMMQILEENPDIGEMPYEMGDIPYEKAMRLLESSEPDSLKLPLKLKVCDLLCEDRLDGIEVYNGNCNWIQDPDKIRRILERHPEYIRTSASDFHEKCHLARGGMVLDRRVTNSEELAAVLRSGGILERIQSK